jgi:hypothetical protein
MASNDRKEARHIERFSLGLIHKKEPTYGGSNKEKTLAKIKEVCGQEYVEQLKEGKHHTAKSLLDSINQQNMSIYRQMGITDIEILAKIQEGIDEQEKSGVLKGKFDSILKVGVKGSNRFVPKAGEARFKKKILSDLKASVEKKYLSAKLDGKTLSVEELYALQQESWKKKSNTNMIEMYGKMGITEDDIKQTITEAIDSYK